MNLYKNLFATLSNSFTEPKLPDPVEREFHILLDKGLGKRLLQCVFVGGGGARERSLQREDRGTEIPNHSSFLLIGST